MNIQQQEKTHQINFSFILMNYILYILYMFILQLFQFKLQFILSASKNDNQWIQDIKGTHKMGITESLIYGRAHFSNLIQQFKRIHTESK